MTTLLQLIKSHGFHAEDVGGKIKAILYLTDRDGNLDCEIVTIEPSASAVREALGY